VIEIYIAALLIRKRLYKDSARRGVPKEFGPHGSPGKQPCTALLLRFSATLSMEADR
jgi:hypothetical protein